MEKKIAPSEGKAQERRAMLHGQSDAQRGEEWLSMLGRLSTERVLQEAVEREQAVAVGRGRYEPRCESHGDRNGSENGTLKAAEGVLRVKVPQIRGRDELYRSLRWSQRASTSDVLKQLTVTGGKGGTVKGVRSCSNTFRLARREAMQKTRPARMPRRQCNLPVKVRWGELLVHLVSEDPVVGGDLQD